MWKCRVTLFLFTWGWRWAIDVVVAGCWRIDGAGVHCAHCGGSTVAPAQGLGGVKVQAPGSFHDERCRARHPMSRMLSSSSSSSSLPPQPMAYPRLRGRCRAW